MKLLCPIAFAAIFLWSCQTYPGLKIGTPVDFKSPLDTYLEYVPVYPNGVRTGLQISGTKGDRIDRLLVNSESFVSVTKVDINGRFSYSGSTVTSQAGIYQVVMDFSKFYTESADRGSLYLGSAKVGVTIRILAQVTTTESGVDISSLPNLGIAAKFGLLSGTLYVSVIGAASPKITEILPFSSTIDMTSILEIIKAVGSVKGLLYEENTVITPQVIGLRQSRPNQFTQLERFYSAKADAKFDVGKAKKEIILEYLNTKNDKVAEFRKLLSQASAMETSTKEAYGKLGSLEDIASSLDSDIAASQKNIDILYDLVTRTDK